MPKVWNSLAGVLKLEPCLTLKGKYTAADIPISPVLSRRCRVRILTMASKACGPGLLYVNSKITSPDLSPELFTQWYQDIHIRDIFLTTGIKSAFRYFTWSSEPATIERPYLALYPVKDVAFLYTAEFKAIPIHSDVLPVESKSIFDLADFDTRYYINIGKLEGEGYSECKSSRSMTCEHCPKSTSRSSPFRHLCTI
jgi:hypothetical protein